jgi:hypothetical protein
MDIHRGIMTFSLLSIPLLAAIDSARFMFRGLGHNDTLGDKPRIAVFQSYPLADNNIVKADYNRLYNVCLSNEIGYDDFTITGFNAFQLTEAGLALLKPGEICRLGLRESKFDAPGLPPPGTAGTALRFFGASRDHTTTTYRPYLEVTYRPVV